MPISCANITCPGWQRPPIDSEKFKLDGRVGREFLVGLINRCVTVKLANGTIIEQNIYPSNHCQEIFIKSWKILLYSQYIDQIDNPLRPHSQWNPEEEVLIDCCTDDLCNAPPGHQHAWSSAPSHAPALLLGLATSWCLLLLRL